MTTSSMETLGRQPEAYPRLLEEAVTQRTEQLGTLVAGYESATTALVRGYKLELRGASHEAAPGVFASMETQVESHILEHTGSIAGHMRDTALGLRGMLSGEDRGVLGAMQEAARRRDHGIGSDEYRAARAKVSCREAGWAIDLIMDDDIRGMARQTAVSATKGFASVLYGSNEVDKLCGMGSRPVTRKAIRASLDREVHRLSRQTAASTTKGFTSQLSGANEVDRIGGMASNLGTQRAIRASHDRLVYTLTRETAGDRYRGLRSVLYGEAETRRISEMASCPRACSHIAASVGLSRPLDVVELRQESQDIRGAGVVRRRRLPRLMGLVAAASLVVGFSGTYLYEQQGASGQAPAAAGSPSTHPHASHPKALPSLPKARPSASPMNTEEYYESQARAARIQAAVVSFGRTVLVQSKSSNSPWGVFDAYCHPGDDPVGRFGGWTSQNYTPKPGDVCTLQHNPQYGGGNGTQVSADVLVGANGGYTSTFNEVQVRYGACNVRVEQHNGFWDVNLQGLRSDTETDQAPTAAAAKKIDDEALACLTKAPL